MNGSNPLLDAALSYAAIGWRIIPLHGIRPILPDELATLTATSQTPESFSVPDSDSRLCCTCQKGPLCTVPGKHPRIRMGKAYANATTDAATIRQWWRRWPNSNVGIATGRRREVMPSDVRNPKGGTVEQPGPALVVVDIDGSKGAATLLAAIAAAGLTRLPRTLMASSGRRDGGVHLYYLSELCPQSSGDGLDSRGDGGLAVAPPSQHVSGATYSWLTPLETGPVALPTAFANWLANRPRGGTRVKSQKTSVVPAHLQNRTTPTVKDRLKKALQRPFTPEDVQAAVAAMANPELGWDDWNRVGMAIWSCDPSQEGLNAFEAFSAKSTKYTEGACEERWAHYPTSPPTDLGYGSLVHWAQQATNNPQWRPPSQARRAEPATSVDSLRASTPPVTGQNIGIQNQTASSPPFPLPSSPLAAPEQPHLNGHANGHQFLPAIPPDPLVELNKRYAAIRNIGNRCLIFERVPWDIDNSILIPSFQAFGDFERAYANEYYATQADPEPKQVGKSWTKWRGRRTYAGITLEPNKPEVIETGKGNILNLWTGFACQPVKGNWSRMQDHIFSILANGITEYAEYILRYAAWCVQNPGERAEAALVFKGGKGSGKGTFANALKSLFGHHGLQIYSSRHLTGNFNGHLRTCLLLFADEAFWAGDKQGESVLKGMLTEAALTIEQKGVDAMQWRNRLHVIMAANNDWVVPASHDERRYAMFEVSDKRVDDQGYFDALHAELMTGGLAAMLHDLLAAPLGNWHPRKIVRTEALQAQKARSLDTYHEWLESLLQQGELPTVSTPTAEYVCQASTLLGLAREAGGRHAHLVTAGMLGRFLKKWGCIHIHRSQGSAWRFPPLAQLRGAWEARFGIWKWDIDLKSWNERLT